MASEISSSLNNKSLYNNKVTGFFSELFRNRALYLMVLPAMALLFIFNYLPLFGLILAFKDFKASKGIFGSDWMNPFYENFRFLVNSSQAFRAIQNTVFLNVLFIITGTTCAVVFSLLLNEIRSKLMKRMFQTMTLLPHFISWIIVGVFLYNLLSYENGVINGFLFSMGLEKVSWYSVPNAWPLILVLIHIWKDVGYGGIIYLAALVGIDTAYYEAAKIDGASRIQQVWHISVPMIRPTIIILFLLQLGKIMNADFGMFYATVGDASLLYPTTDVIDTFVYRSLRVVGDVGMASATGFFQSILSFLIVVGSNKFVRKIDENSALF